MNKETENKINRALELHSSSLTAMVEAIETAVDETGEITFVHYDSLSIENWTVRRVCDNAENADDCDYVIFDAEGREVSTLEDNDANTLFDICSTINEKV